jgi:hypothetical protein
LYAVDAGLCVAFFGYGKAMNVMKQFHMYEYEVL